jgi:GATA-binding protein
MKSDVIRKRSRHDARRANGVEETPSASPGASRRTSPVTDGIPNQQPTLSPDSTTQMSYDEAEFRTSSQSELMGALGDDHQFSQNSYSSSLGFNTFPGPYHPDYLSQNYLTPSDPPPFPSDDHSDEVADFRVNKRRRMSTDSASEPPSSAVSGYSSYAESYATGGTSVTSHSRASSMDFPYNTYSSSFNYLRGTTSALWHPPMLLPDNSPQVVHPPMSLPEESPMDFLHPPMLPHEDEALFAAYIHPPMALPDSPPVSLNSLQLQHHAPAMTTGMEYTKHDQQHNFYESMNHHSMHTY